MGAFSFSVNLRNRRLAPAPRPRRPHRRQLTGPVRGHRGPRSGALGLPPKMSHRRTGTPVGQSRGWLRGSESWSGRSPVKREKLGGGIESNEGRSRPATRSPTADEACHASVGPTGGERPRWECGDEGGHVSRVRLCGRVACPGRSDADPGRGRGAGSRGGFVGERLRLASAHRKAVVEPCPRLHQARQHRAGGPMWPGESRQWDPR